MTRIEHPKSSGPKWALFGGIVAAALVAWGSFYFSRTQENKVVERDHWVELEVPEDKQLRRQLTLDQYLVTRQNGTETAFRNVYWDEKRAGIYVDIITNEPLFSSIDKFDNGIGWPSFTKPIEPEHITTNIDDRYGMTRTQVRARKSQSHLGHLFNDGPPPTGFNYQVNSAALRFVPVEKFKEEGYGKYLPLFEGANPTPTPTPTLPK
ncbi:MAG TPA: peptide-methionine (R)-S-oxide reductase MsrB [Chthoniobacterales bacterium]